MGPKEDPQPRVVFKNHTKNQAEEDAYDFSIHRQGVKLTSVFGSVAHIVKGALGGGILSGHVAYMKAGVAVSLPLNIVCGLYMGFCLYLLIYSAQIIYKRTRVPLMSYSDVGEASLAVFPNPKVQRFGKVFRYIIDAIVCIDLFGSCACYQIIIAKTIKQLVENTDASTFEGLPGYPSLRVYLAIMIPFVVLICLIRHLKWLAPFSVAANIVIVFCILTAIYYAFALNPKFENMVLSTTLWPTLEANAMIVFSMSCAGIIIAIENNMRDPHKFPTVIAIGMLIIIICTVLTSLFGYAAFLDKSDSPITINFPMGVWPKILKGAIALMIYVTHAVNYWVPFDLCFHYIKKRLNQQKLVFWELFYRALFVVIIGLVAILFPDITALMGFIGAFCLSNMAFVWPIVINLLVIYERPGFGKYQWRFWRGIALIVAGLIILVIGTMVTVTELVSVFVKVNIKGED